MVTPNHNRCFEFAIFHHFIERQARQMPLAQAEPANSRRQALKGNAFLRHVEPTVHMRVVREQLFNFRIGFVNVLRIARQRHPAERPFAFAEQRTDVGRYKPWEIKSVFHARVQSDLTDVVAIVHCGDAHRVKIQHRLDVLRARLRRVCREFGVLCGVRLCGFPLRHRPTDGQITVDEVMCRSLVGDQVGLHSAILSTLDQFRQNLCRIAKQADGHRFATLAMVFDQSQRVVQIARLFVQVARAQAKIDARLLAFNIQRDRARKRRRQRLRAAHAAQTSGQNPTPFPIAIEVLTTRFDKGFIRALHDALRANVNPTARRHLSIHKQTLAVEFIEMFPIRPFGHEVRIGNQHTRRIAVGFKHAHWFTRLHEQGFILVQFFEGSEDGVVALPIARRTTDAAIHHKVLWIFSNFRIKVVLNHAVRCFGQPVFTAQLCATWCVDDTAFIVAWVTV